MDREPDQIRATNFKGEQLGGITFYADVPDECPICHANVDPKRIRGIIRGGYALKVGQLTYDCRYSTMHGMPVTGGRGFRGLKPLWYNGVPP